MKNKVTMGGWVQAMIYTIYPWLMVVWSILSILLFLFGSYIFKLSNFIGFFFAIFGPIDLIFTIPFQIFVIFFILFCTMFVKGKRILFIPVIKLLGSVLFLATMKHFDILPKSIMLISSILIIIFCVDILIRK